MSSQISVSQWLVGRGLTWQQADLWGDFIAESLELLSDGHALLRTQSEWDSFISGCKGSVPTEPEITSGLGDRMKRLRNDAPLDSDRDRISVQYEAPTPGDDRHGTRKTKADFCFERKFEAGSAVSFVVEAKPLARDSDISVRYLGVEGLGCFTQRQYPYSVFPVAGLVGYIKKQSAWVSGLVASVKQISLRSEFVAVRSRKSLASDHSRAAGLPDITIIHELLDFL